MAIALMGAGFSATDTSDAVNILYPITMTVQANKARQASGLKKSFFYHPTKSSWWRKDKLCKALGDVVFRMTKNDSALVQHRCIARALGTAKKADVAKSVDAADFKIECPRGNPRSRTAQSRGTLTGIPKPIPSQAPSGEGVETGRAAPKPSGNGEGTVQTTNVIRRRRKSRWYENLLLCESTGSSPVVRTTKPNIPAMIDLWAFGREPATLALRFAQASKAIRCAHRFRRAPSLRVHRWCVHHYREHGLCMEAVPLRQASGDIR